MIPVYHGGGGECKTFRNFFDSKLVKHVENFHKCLQFFGQFNNLRSKFDHLQPDIQGNLLKSHCCSFFSVFYGDIIQMDSKKMYTMG